MSKPSPTDSTRAAMVAYLMERGITEEHADTCGFEPLDASASMALAGSPKACGRASFRIPYRDLDGKPIGFEQLRFIGEAVGFKPTKEIKKPLRYWQEAGSSTPVYLPPVIGRPWRKVAADPTADLVITEGVAKATAACLHGFPTMAATSVDTWHVSGDKTHLAAGLDAFEMKGRFVAIAFDSDAATKPGVVRAERELRSVLEERGAFVQIVRLPPATNGGKQGLDDYLKAEGPEAFRKLLATVDRLPEALDDAASLLDGEIPPVEYVVAPYLPRSEVVEAHGPHGVGKSTILLGAALSVATGQPWGGFPVVRGKAAFVSLEDTKPTLARRVRAWVEGTARVRKHATDRASVDAKDLARGIRDNFLHLGREKAAPLVLTNTGFGQTTINGAAVDRLVKLCAGCAFVVLETGARLHPGPETNESLAVFATAVERIVTRTGACVVIVRHVSKEVARTGMTDSYGGRGGGSFADMARSVLAVSREGDGDDAPIKLVHAKSTHSARGLDLMWRTEVHAGAVHMRPLSAEERANVGAGRVLDRIREAGEDGVTLREIVKQAFPPNVRKERARDLPDLLRRLEQEGVIVSTEERGRSGPPTTRYRTTAAQAQHVARSASPAVPSPVAVVASSVAKLKSVRRARA